MKNEFSSELIWREKIFLWFLIWKCSENFHAQGVILMEFWFFTRNKFLNDKFVHKWRKWEKFRLNSKENSTWNHQWWFSNKIKTAKKPWETASKFFWVFLNKKHDSKKIEKKNFLALLQRKFKFEKVGKMNWWW